MIYHHRCNCCGAEVVTTNRGGNTYCEYCNREIQREVDRRKSWINWKPPVLKRGDVRVTKDPENLWGHLSQFSEEEHRMNLLAGNYLPGTELVRKDGSKIIIDKNMRVLFTL